MEIDEGKEWFLDEQMLLSVSQLCLKNNFYTIVEPVNVLVACGPYTTSDTLAFDPLLDLIGVINRDQPDVCLLVKKLLFISVFRDTRPFLKLSFTNFFF